MPDGLMIAIGGPGKKPGRDLAPEAGMRATGGRPAGGGAPVPYAGAETPAEEAAENAHMADGTMTCPNCGCEYDLVKREAAPDAGMAADAGMSGGAPPPPV